MPLVTVVTAARNAAQFLPEAMASIANQSMGDLRHVIVDDASTDSTAALVETAASIDPRVTLIRLAQNVGPYQAANIAMASGDCAYFARLDADDVAAPQRLQIQVEALRSNPRMRGCTGAWQPLLRNGSVAPIRRLPSTRNRVLKWLLFLRNPFVHSTLMIDAERFHQLGGYGPEPVAEDARLWSRLIRSEEVVVVDDLLVQYRFSDSQITARPGSADETPRLRVRHEHLRACTGHDWSDADARDFRHVGTKSSVSAKRALALLDAWDAAWRLDTALDELDRRELSDYSAARRVGHLRLAVRSRPFEVVTAVAQHANPVLRSALRTARYRRGRQWR